MNKNVIFSNSAGTILDKVLPLIISLILSSLITADDFGKWVLFYQFLLFINAIVVSPLLGFFNRKFYLSKDEQKLIFYNYSILISLFVVTASIYYFFFAITIKHLILELFIAISFIFYNYYVQYLRFRGEDTSYVLSAALRFFIFISVLGLLFLLNNTLRYYDLLLAFGAAHFIVFIKVVINTAYEETKVSGGELKEFLSLSFYGLFTSSVNGIDKFLIIAIGGSAAFLGAYSYFLALASAPSIIVETAKKIITPLQFKQYTLSGEISSQTKSTIIKFLSFFLFAQILLPQFLYIILQYLNLINPDFVNVYKPELIILIFSLGLYIFSIYHFINPILIFYKKSFFMTVSLSIGILIYVILMLYFRNTQNLILNSGLKALMLIISVFFTFIFVKKVKA